MILRFGGHLEGDDNDECLMDHIIYIFRSVHLLALHKRTSRALAKQLTMLVGIYQSLRKDRAMDVKCREVSSQSVTLLAGTAFAVTNLLRGVS